MSEEEVAFKSSRWGEYETSIINTEKRRKIYDFIDKLIGLYTDQPPKDETEEMLYYIDSMQSIKQAIDVIYHNGDVQSFQTKANHDER